VDTAPEAGARDLRQTAAGNCATFSFETSKENAAPGKRKMFYAAKPSARWADFLLVAGVVG